MTAGVISSVDASRLCVSVFRNQSSGFLTPQRPERPGMAQLDATSDIGPTFLPTGAADGSRQNR
jgi:hypothetical protein